MIRFLVGLVVGIYIAQEYKDKVPNVKTAVLNLLKQAEENIRDSDKKSKD